MQEDLRGLESATRAYTGLVMSHRRRKEHSVCTVPLNRYDTNMFVITNNVCDLR